MNAPIDSAELEQRWQALPGPAGDRLSVERLRDWAGGAVLAAVDSSGCRHLLVRIPEGRPGRLPRPVAGLSLAYRRLQPPGQPDGAWLDLASTDRPETRRPFTGLCADIAAELPATGGASPSALFTIVERWRRFWSVDHAELGREQQIGLFGELWLLLEWLPALTENTLTAWQGPLGGRHDFVSETVSVETKTTDARTGPMMHRITSLDQLDEPAHGQLYLMSLRVASDPLADQSLAGLLRRTSKAAHAAGSACQALLEERLAQLGVAADDTDRYTDPLKLVEQQLFLVGPGFPRIIRTTFPDGPAAGVLDITYTLDTTACRPWLVTTEPGHNNPLLALA